jgi:hypothetical protein
VNLTVSPTTVNEDDIAKLVYTFARTGVTNKALTVNYGEYLMTLIDNIIDPTEPIAGRTQSEWGDKYWQWTGTTPQDDNPVRDRTGDFAAINQKR